MFSILGCHSFTFVFLLHSLRAFFDLYHNDTMHEPLQWFMHNITFLLALWLNYSLSGFKWHKSNFKNLLMKSSEIVFIFLPAFYLIIWLITSPKNSEKISILKIWQLVFFRVVKLCFGKFLLKWCIFRLEKYDSHK